MEAPGKGGKTAQKREAEKEKSTSYNPEECPVCITGFDDTVQRPRSLPCGHTICTLCVNKLKQQGLVACPECRISHAVPEGGMFPVSYIAEALIKRKKDGEAAAAAALPPSSAGTGKGAAAAAGQKDEAGLSRKTRSFLQEQEASVMAAITACQEVQAQLDQYQTTLTGWGEKQHQLEDRLQDLLDQSRSARELVRQEESRAASKKEEAMAGELQLHTALEALRSPATEQEARVVVAEVLRYTFDAKEVLEECRESFPDANIAITVRKVREASDAALRAFQAALKAHPSVAKEESMTQPEPNCTIDERLQAILTPRLKAEDLRNPTEPVRRLLKAGLVFGVNQVDDKGRHARISLEAGRVYLHTLKNGPLPPGGLALQVRHVVPPYPPCMVFLDLSWPGCAPQRVHIRLHTDTPRGRQAVLLCTGQRGPSYAGTRLFGSDFGLDSGLAFSFNIGHHTLGEHVWGGDYESNNGRGGAALLPGLFEGEYLRSGKVGAVFGRFSCDPVRGAQFAIITKEYKNDRVRRDVFGEVVQGLDVVAAVKNTPSGTPVTIQDCGVVV